MKQKALFVFPRKIFPIVGGDQIRAYQQLEFLSEIYDVFLVYMNENEEPEDYALRFMPQLIGSRCLKHSKFHGFLNMTKSIFNFLPLQVNYYTTKTIKKRVKELSASYDIAFSGNTRVAEYIKNLTQTKYLDYVDAASMNCKNAIREAKGLKKIFYIIDSYLMRRYELSILKEFDSCAIISVVDKNFLMKWIK